MFCTVPILITRPRLSFSYLYKLLLLLPLCCLVRNTRNIRQKRRFLHALVMAKRLVLRPY